MTESFDHAALIGALRRKAEFLRRTVGESESFYVMLTAADALEEAERERDEWKRLFSECHPVHLDGVRRAYEAERRIAAVEALLTESEQYPVGVMFGGAPFPQFLLASKLRAALHPVAETTEKGGE